MTNWYRKFCDDSFAFCNSLVAEANGTVMFHGFRRFDDGLALGLVN
ncbi:hypothetical protein COLO4_24216 [Corchorus olitorius]|uniref:Uncharacterized protein n=1 Tax=Corchorus olitorius TaxID=93759 RepID=A0A1R3IC58_9ROSI|nr:hypothetical protein COLO4_24216 [Corchorus olitorius]